MIVLFRVDDDSFARLDFSCFVPKKSTNEPRHTDQSVGDLAAINTNTKEFGFISLFQTNHILYSIFPSTWKRSTKIAH